MNERKSLTIAAVHDFASTRKSVSAKELVLAARSLDVGVEDFTLNAF